MFDLTWQSIATLVCVAGAIVYVVRASWQVFRGADTRGCGSCSGCEPEHGAKSVPLVPLQLEPPGKRR